MSKEFIGLKPSMPDYARMLVLLVRDSENMDDRRWAGDELVRIITEQDSALQKRTEPELDQTSDHKDARDHFDHVHQTHQDNDTQDLY